MSLKTNEILFTGPFDTKNYVYKKNKPATLILIVKKNGKNYDPVFYGLKIIKADKEDLDLSNIIKNLEDLKSENYLGIFIREYKLVELEKFQEDFTLLSKKLKENGQLLMQY